MHIDDLREIASDTALRKLIGLKNMPAASTVGDWLRRKGNGMGLAAIKKIIDKTNEKALSQHEAKEFTIAADKDAAVKRTIERVGKWQPLKTKDGLTTDREIAETVHTMGRTKQAFRLVVLRWQRQQQSLFEPDKYCYHAIVSNLECSPQEVVWRYNERGQAENVIKELKGGFGLDSLPSGDFGANSFWFAFSSIGLQYFYFAEGVGFARGVYAKDDKDFALVADRGRGQGGASWAAAVAEAGDDIGEIRGLPGDAVKLSGLCLTKF